MEISMTCCDTYFSRKITHVGTFDLNIWTGCIIYWRLGQVFNSNRNMIFHELRDCITDSDTRNVIWFYVEKC